VKFRAFGTNNGEQTRVHEGESTLLEDIVHGSLET
jgi:hypothetical protein